MSSRSSKNFRRRSGEEKSTPNPNPNPNPTTITKSQIVTLAKPNAQQKKPESSTRLSFADDEEDDGPFAPRLAAARTPFSSSSAAVVTAHKLTSSKDRSLPSTPSISIPSNVQPQAGEYTKERLRELQKNARPLGSMPKPQKQEPTSLPEPKPPQKIEPVIVLKGLLKPSLEREKDQILLPPEKREDGDEDGVDDEAENRRFAKMDIDGKSGGSSGIPDQAMINAIRAKRERLRQSRAAAPDYISLDDGGVLSSRASGGESSEDEEIQGRIALFGDKKDGRRVKKGVFEDIDDRAVLAETRIVDGGFGVGDDDEDDEEEEGKKWEEEQLRKAGYGKRIDEATTLRAANVQSIQPQPSIYRGVPNESSMSSLSLGSSSIGVTRSVDVMSIPQQADVATRALQENINRLQESHSRTLTSLVRTEENLSEALTDITTLEKSLEAAGEKYVFMQQIRDFISVMCHFLNDKASLIEELEEQMQKLHEERASVVEERRSGDITDEAIEVEAAMSAAISVLSKGSSPAFISAATTAAQAAAAAAKENLNLPIQLDEYGRDVNLQKRMDYTRRGDSRKRRRSRSESKRVLFVGKDGEGQQIEGELSTDESDSESSAYQSSHDELLQTAGLIFSDAADEYSNLSIVKARFEKWKKQYSSSYRDAYISLSASAVFSPFVRLELLKWDPLYSKILFSDMEWHNILLDYGSPGDEDDNLIPELVEKVALPILHHEIEYCWDILSTQMTRNAVSATDMVVIYLQPSSKALHELLTVVHTRLTKAIASIDVPILKPIVMKAVPGAAQFAAYRFGMSVRLLRNICLWKDILPMSILENLALEGLLAGKLLPHVRSSMSNIHDAITRTERIVSSLAGVWSGRGVKMVHNPKLQPLVDCVTELGRKLEKRYAAGVSEEETLGLVRRLKTMFVQLNAYDKAQALLKTFQLKEAL